MGATFTTYQKPNTQVYPQGQRQYGGTFVGPTSMISIGPNDWFNPHTEPSNSTLVGADAHAPAIPPFAMRGMGSGFNLVFRQADGLKPPVTAKPA